MACLGSPSQVHEPLVYRLLTVRVISLGLSDHLRPPSQTTIPNLALVCKREGLKDKR